MPKTTRPDLDTLPRRERQVMDAVYKLERGTVRQVLLQLEDERNYSTVRTQLQVLEQKGHVRHETVGFGYVYFPVVPRDVARRSALRHVIDTFFEGSVEKIVAALLGEEILSLSPDELDRLIEKVARSKDDAGASETTNSPPRPQPISRPRLGFAQGFC